MSSPLAVGASAQETYDVTPAMVKTFADLVGDHNPVHLDADYAAQTQFKKPIAHGMIVGGLFSSILATKLPGPGAIYLSQSMTFKSPVFVGDSVVIKVEVTKKHKSKPIYFVDTICESPDGKLHVKGEAVVLWG